MLRVIALTALCLMGCERDDADYDSRHRFVVMIAEGAPTEDLCIEAKRNADQALYADDVQEYRYWLKHRKDFCRLLAAKKS